jgi:hypothetical protein
MNQESSQGSFFAARANVSRSVLKVGSAPFPAHCWGPHRRYVTKVTCRLTSPSARTSIPLCLPLLPAWNCRAEIMVKDRPKRKAGGAKPTTAKASPPAKQRAARRCPFVASAEVTEISSETHISARTSELAVGGCYIETLNPFPEGTLVHVRILRDQGVFEAKATVVYSHSNSGMGLAFSEMLPKQRLLLEDWLAEIVIQSRSTS